MSNGPEMSPVEQQIQDEYQKLRDVRERIKELRASIPPEPVRDYEFGTIDGPVALSALFGERSELMVIHNMGKQCPMCTMWADGFNGLQHHLADRAAFVVSSPDTPQDQRAFALSRGWNFRMVSTAGSSFAKDLKMADDRSPWPGVSTFRKHEDGTIVRLASCWFGPWDDFNPAYHLFDLFLAPDVEWWPKLAY